MFECGFDAGDCGTDKYDQLHGMMLTPDVKQYTLPAGKILTQCEVSYVNGFLIYKYTNVQCHVHCQSTVRLSFH